MEREGRRPDNLFPCGGLSGFSSGGPDRLSNSQDNHFLRRPPRAAPSLLSRGQERPTYRGEGDRRSQSPSFGKNPRCRQHILRPPPPATYSDAASAEMMAGVKMGWVAVPPPCLSPAAPRPPAAGGKFHPPKTGTPPASRGGHAKEEGQHRAGAKKNRSGAPSRQL